MRNLVLLLAAVLSVGSIRAETTVTKPAPKAEKKTAEKYKESDAKSGLYIEPGVSALIFNGPKRETPIASVDFPGPTLNFNNYLLRPAEETDVAPAARFAIGYTFKNMPSWLGQGFGVEGSGNYWFAQSHSTQIIPQVPLAFSFLYDDATPGRAVDFAGSGFPITPDAVCSIQRTSDNQYFDANVTAKTHYRFSNLLTFAPSLGLFFASLDHDARVVSSGGVEVYRLNEELCTDFLGGTVGLDLTFNPFQKFSFTLGGSVSPVTAGSRARVSNSWENNGFPGSGNLYHFKDSDHEFTFRTTGTGSVTYQAFSWFSISAFGGIEYWDKIAVIDYPSYSTGTNVFAANTGFPKIGYKSMTNFRTGLNFKFTFGK